MAIVALPLISHVEIRSGIIEGVWLFVKGGFELKTKCKQEASDYFQICSSGDIVPLPNYEELW